MQIKSDQAAPVMTLTPRTNTMAIDGRIGARGATDLSKFIGVWVVAEMKVVYGNSGSVALTIRKHLRRHDAVQLLGRRRHLGRRRQRPRLQVRASTAA